MIDAISALFDGSSLVTVSKIVLVEAPSAAVITVVMVFVPTLKGMPADGKPDDTNEPFTVIVAFGSAAVGITCIDVVVFDTTSV